MNESIEKVKAFHELFEHPVGKLNTPESLKIRQLRIKLCFEELKELAEAGDVRHTFQMLCHESLSNNTADWVDGDNVNKLEELDALCDIQYVLNGKILTAGLHEIFDREFDKVHLNNMTKAHTTREHAEATLAKSLNGEGTVVEKKQYLNSYVGFKTYYTVLNKDGKVTKPHDHKKVALSLES